MSDTPNTTKGEATSAGHVLRIVRQRLGGHVLTQKDERIVEDRAKTQRTSLLTLLGFLRRDRDTFLDMLVDISAVDHGSEHDGDRFEIFYRLRSSRLPYRLWLSVDVPMDDPAVPSVISIHAAAQWYERELYDLFGIRAEGQSDGRRLLLYPGFMGHPGRRDYPGTKGQSLVPLRTPKVPPVHVSEDGTLSTEE